MTSPFAALPPEVLAAVFVNCNRNSTVNLPPGPGFYPWALGHVCSQWRNVLWNSPEVWCFIDIWGRDGGSYFHSPEPWNALEEILTRTEGLIYLSLHHCGGCYVPDVIFEFSHRFRGLEFDCIPQYSLFTLLKLPRGSLAHLESLTVTFEGIPFMSPPITSRFETLRHDLPSLRRLSLGGSALAPPYISYLPLSQLTNLSLTTENTTASDIHSIVRHCSSLISAEFWISPAVPTSKLVPHPTIIVPGLETLTIKARRTVDLEVLQDPLILPSLRSLTITSQYGPEFSGALTSLLSRSGCALQDLSIHPYWSPGTTQHPDLSQQLLVQMPSLISFLSAYVASPAPIRLVHGGQLPHLASATWLVFPEGLTALLDILDERVSRPPSSPNNMCRIRVTCLAADAAPVWRRFARNCEAYRGVGFDLTVHTASGIDVRYMTG